MYEGKALLAGPPSLPSTAAVASLAAEIYYCSVDYRWKYYCTLLQRLCTPFPGGMYFALPCFAYVYHKRLDVPFTFDSVGTKSVEIGSNMFAML
jgi:hypothetical protein